MDPASSVLSRVHEFEAISEGVVHIAALVTSERLVIDNLDTRDAQPADERCQIRDEQRGVGLLRRAKVLLDPEMELQLASLKPATTSCREMRGLRNFRNSQETGVELGRSRFSAGRHRQLHVLDPLDGHPHRMP